MTTHNPTHSGGCLCGAVRFVASGDPVGGNHCHCDMCRKDSGSGVSTFVTFATGSVTWDGKPTDYERLAWQVSRLLPEMRIKHHLAQWRQ